MYATSNNNNNNNVSSLSLVNNVSTIINTLYTWEVKQNDIRNMG